MDKRSLEELINKLKDDYPIEELLYSSQNDFERGKVVGRLLLIKSLERLLDDNEE